MFRYLLHRSLWVLTMVLATAAFSCRRVPDPPSPDDTSLFAACVIPGSSSTIDIITFNVQGFPMAGYTSVTSLSALVKAIDPDIVALQEVASEADFNRLVKLMPGWTGAFYPINNDDWNLAYLIKNSEMEIIPGTLRTLFEDDFWAFPRPPFEIMVRHKGSGRELLLINLHLKCCGGADNESRRRSASQQLKEYLDGQRADDAVVMLGDYNDEITSASAAENPFLNFIEDADDYSFTDMAIATGSQLWWSYPSWPSHIDHILVTNELFASIDTTVVIKASPCYPDYGEVLSDHRPVGVRIIP
ncbi:MAG: endonuclease/exonuclease/phosphatase family protein [Bacteroidales bacterium]|nr:endonuclease/exonuclease/phosphatase family protein [Bacteroidales bacterium]